MWEFNAMKRVDKILNSQFCSTTTLDFNRFISNIGLHDLRMGGRKFSCMCDDGLKLSKLNIFLVRSNFIFIQPLSLVTTLLREFSNRSVILLCSDSRHFGPTSFRFFNSRLLREVVTSIFINTCSSFNGFDT